MDDKIHFFCLGDIQNMIVIGEEIMSTPPSLNLGMNRVIKAEMSIGEEQDFDGVSGHGNWSGNFRVTILYEYQL